MFNSTNKEMLKKAFTFLIVFLSISFVNTFSQAVVITPLDSIKVNDSDGISVLAGDPSINVTGIVTSTV